MWSLQRACAAQHDYILANSSKCTLSGSQSKGRISSHRLPPSEPGVRAKIVAAFTLESGRGAAAVLNRDFQGKIIAGQVRYILFSLDSRVGYLSCSLGR